MKRVFLSLFALFALIVTGVMATHQAQAITRKQNFGARQWHFDKAKYAARKVNYISDEKPGTIIIDTGRHYLYLILGHDKAMRYGIGVGRSGFQWSGVAQIGNKAEWPDWHPPKEMIERELKEYHRRLPDVMKGGPENPLGARAMYLYQNGRDTLYRIHGTSQPWTIGHNVSSGCIRLRNEDVIDLYKRAKVGAKVIVKKGGFW